MRHKDQALAVEKPQEECILQEDYHKERKVLIDGEWEAARSFDKAMLTLSAGALGLSITFIDKIA